MRVFVLKSYGIVNVYDASTPENRTNLILFLDKLAQDDICDNSARWSFDLIGQSDMFEYGTGFYDLEKLK